MSDGLRVASGLQVLFTQDDTKVSSPGNGDCRMLGLTEPTSPSSVGGRGLSGATTGVVITGSVSGMPALPLLSETYTTLAASKPVTVTVVGTIISATIDRHSRFHLTDVPVGDVQLKFAGEGLDATLMLKGVEAGDRIDIKVRLTDTSVRIEAERRDRRGRDDDDDDDDDDGQD